MSATIERQNKAGLTLTLSVDPPNSMYQQIENQVRELIVSERLPSVRALAKGLGCSVITTRRAYQDLESERLIRSRQGAGTVVAELDMEQRACWKLESILRPLADTVSRARKLGFCHAELREVLEEVDIRGVGPEDAPRH